jgi:hypothetical protein
MHTAAELFVAHQRRQIALVVQQVLEKLINVCGLG